MLPSEVDERTLTRTFFSAREKRSADHSPRTATHARANAHPRDRASEVRHQDTGSAVYRRPLRREHDLSTSVLSPSRSRAHSRTRMGETAEESGCRESKWRRQRDERTSMERDTSSGGRDRGTCSAAREGLVSGSGVRNSREGGRAAWRERRPSVFSSVAIQQN